jgi:hypothetical protein
VEPSIAASMSTVTVAVDARVNVNQSTSPGVIVSSVLENGSVMAVA